MSVTVRAARIGGGASQRVMLPASPWSGLGADAVLPYFQKFPQARLTLPETARLVHTLLADTAAAAGWDQAALADTPLMLGSTSYALPDCEAEIAERGALS